MGGNAFHSMLESSAFPRLPPAVYCALKARIQPLLEELYEYVCVPHEAPEKRDHGDLDFAVYLPRGHTAASQIPAHNGAQNGENNEGSGGDEARSINVPHTIVSAAIGARYINPMDGNRTSNFAVPIDRGEWAQYGFEAEEKSARERARNGEIFFQVDVNVCESKAELERRVIFSSYGDLNMILGLIAKNAGLHFSHKGLKYPDAPNPPITLSESFDDIFAFFGWSMEAWKVGFETTLACYEWAATSEYFNPAHIKAREQGDKKTKPGRRMYTGFLEWAGGLSQQSPSLTKNSETPDAREAALDFFNKRSELIKRREEERRRELLKNFFSGSCVRDWTGLGNYWLGVKKIMSGVREKFGGEADIARFLDEEGAERLRCIVLEVQTNLGIFPLPPKKAPGVEEMGAEKMDKINSGTVEAN